MIVGVPQEIKSDEYRVGLLPVGAHLFTEDGQRVLVESGAGRGVRFKGVAPHMHKDRRMQPTMERWCVLVTRSYAKDSGNFRGFSLIELLVVIAIISLLVSILLPSLSKAKALAKATACMTQLSGIAKALMIYANDHGDFYPPAPCGHSATGICSTCFGTLTLPRCSGNPYTIVSGDVGQYRLQGIGLLWKEEYIDDGRILYCPSAELPSETYTRDWKVDTTTPVSTAYDGRGGYCYRILCTDYTGVAGTPYTWADIGERDARVESVGNRALVWDYRAEKHLAGRLWRNIAYGDGAVLTASDPDSEPYSNSILYYPYKTTNHPADWLICLEAMDALR